MSGSVNDDLAELARLVGAHLDWQRELGVLGVSLPDATVLQVDANAKRAQGSRPVRGAEPTPAVARASQPPTQASEAPRPRLEIPSFLRKSVPPARPDAMASVANTAPPAMTPSVANTAPPAMTPSLQTPSPAANGTAEATISRAPAAPSPPPQTPAQAPSPVTNSGGGDRVVQLAVVNDEVVACTRCRLHEGRTQTVFSRGNPFAELAFVGEGPGRDEDLQGLPFVGAAGQLLDKIIAAMGMREQDVYICNVVKCRPPNNRVPAPDEMASCGPFLVRQLGFVKPRVIVALGKTAVSYLLESEESMTKLRGSWREWQGIALLPTWHPAYLLRNPAAKKDTWDDMKMVLERLGRTAPHR